MQQIGSATFFILYGLRETAKTSEENMVAGTSGLNDLSKFVYLEVLDATFSFDGVVGAFAFTINLLLILIGMGIGAIVVRELTIKGIDSIGKYKYLKNGALTSMGFLGLFMLIESFGIGITIVHTDNCHLPPDWVRFLQVSQATGWIYKAEKYRKTITP